MKRNIIPNFTNAITALKGLKMYGLLGICKTVLALFKAIKNLIQEKGKKFTLKSFRFKCFRKILTVKSLHL